MLPSHARVVIVGGGVIGCSVAYHLTKLGWSDIALVERHKLGCGTTWHSAANFSRLATSASYIRFLGYSREVHQAVEAETGLSVGWRQTGRVQLATTRERLDVYWHIAALGRAVGGVDFEVIPPTEVAKKLPLLRTNDLVGGIWSPYDGRVNPTDYVTALARAARNRGATIVEEAPVTAIRIQNGVVAGVVTAAGEIRCEAIVNCAGLWGRHVGRLAGVDVPLYPAEHFYVLTLPLEGVARDMPAFRDPDALIYGREEVGGLLLGCFEAEVKPIALEALPPDFAFGLLNENWAQFEPYMKSAIHRIPALETAPIRMLLNGPESFTADGSIILGESPQLRGFFVAAGMNSGGVVLAAGVGRTMAEWIVEGAPQIDVSAFDIRRFAGHEAEEVWLSNRLREVPSHFYRMRRRPAEFTTGRMHRLSPLHERLAARGAKFGAVMGWERPNWFASPNSLCDETACVREEQCTALDGVAIFDRSSLGKLEVNGPDAAAALDRLTLTEIAPLPGRAWLAPFLNASAGVESLPIIVCRSAQRWFVLTRAEQIVRDGDWITRHLDPALDVRVKDVTAKFADIVLVGPRMPELLDRFGQGDGSATGLLPGTERALRIGVAQLRVLRCPSTGDWHLLVAPELALGLYDRLVAEGLDLGIRDAGEQAADALRIGRGLLAWGRDVGPNVSAIEAGLTDGRHAKSAGFIGGEALARLGRTAPRRRLRAFTLSREPRVPLEGGEPVWREGHCVGFVSSAAFVVAFDRWVVLALVDVANGNGAHQIDVAGELVALETYVPSRHLEAPA